jgi:multidrug resistance efflux pump
MHTLYSHHDLRARIAPRLRGHDILTEVETTAILRRPQLENGKLVAPDSSPAAETESNQRRRTLLIIAAVLAVLGAAFYYVWFVAPYETTDDAFIQNYAVPISAKLSNIVQKLLVDDNQLVQKGQLLIQIDPRDYQVALLYAQSAYDTAKSNYDRDVALGGSIGISLATTLQERGALAHQALLTKDLTPGNPVYQGVLQSTQADLAQSVEAAQARLMAPGVIYQSLLQQANLFAYVDVFRLLALVSFICILGVFLMKKVSAKGAVAMH